MMIEHLQGNLQAYEEQKKKKHEIEEQLFKIEINLKKKEESLDNTSRQYVQGRGRR